jgi:hypothetical protein
MFRLTVLVICAVTMLPGQCSVNTTEPPGSTSGPVPCAWPKAGVAAAPAYVGYVVYTFYTGEAVDGSGEYLSYFPDNLQADIGTAIYNWNNANQSNGATNNFFQVQGLPTDPFPGHTGSCRYALGNTCWIPWVQFMSVNPQDLEPGDAGETTNVFHDYGYGGVPEPPGLNVPISYSRVGNAYVAMSNAVTNDGFMQWLAAHEIGHTMALGDCPVCYVWASVMTWQVPMNTNQGLIAPSYCDNQQVQNTDTSLLWIGPFGRPASPLPANALGEASLLWRAG